MLSNALFRRSRRRLFCIPLIVAVAIAGCSDRISILAPTINPELPASEVRPIPAPVLSSLRPSAPNTATCGAPTELKLSDGSRVIGTVTLANDATNLYVTYSITSSHWWISDTRLAARKTAGEIPRDGAGRPEPWSFPHAGEHEPPLTSITHQIALNTIGATGGQTIYVAAMAGVVHPRDENNYSGTWDWMVMWGLANTQAPSQVIASYVVNGCAGGGGGGVITPPPPSGSLITITFDDGWKTTVTNAYPVLRDLGLKGNVAVYSQPIDGGWGDFMTLNDLKTLWGAGWKIVSHSTTHRDLTKLSAADLDRELKDSQAWLMKHGFGPTDVFIVPFHSWGARERAAVEKYYKRARGYSIDQFWPEKYVKMPWTEPFDLTAFEPEYAPFTTAGGRALTMEKIDYAVKNGMFLDLLFHRITSSQVASFKVLMTDVAAKYKANISTW